MKTILCYGDSNTYGHNPDQSDPAKARLPRGVRWTGRLQRALGDGCHVIEEGLNGRTTAFDDPTSPGRNGLSALLPCLQTHQPLDLVVLMLGTNDTKGKYSLPAREIASGMEALVRVALNPFHYTARQVPRVLVVSPVRVGEGAGERLLDMFDSDSAARSALLAGEYRRIAELYGCAFLDAARFAGPSPLDRVHLDEAGHEALARALAETIASLL